MAGINSGNNKTERAYTGAMDSTIEEALEGINKNSAFYKSLRHYIEALKAAYGEDLVIQRSTNKLSPFETLYWAANNYTIETDLKARAVGEPVRFKGASGSSYDVTPDSISYVPDNTKFTAQKAMEMAILASQDKTMLDKGVTLTGSKEERALLAYAIAEINKISPTPLKINSGTSVIPSLEARREWNAFIKSNADEKGNFDYTTEIPYTQKYKKEQQARAESESQQNQESNSKTKSGPSFGESARERAGRAWGTTSEGFKKKWKDWQASRQAEKEAQEQARRNADEATRSAREKAEKAAQEEARKARDEAKKAQEEAEKEARDRAKREQEENNNGQGQRTNSSGQKLKADEAKSVLRSAFDDARLGELREAVKKVQPDFAKHSDDKIDGLLAKTFESVAVGENKNKGLFNKIIEEFSKSNPTIKTAGVTILRQYTNTRAQHSSGPEAKAS